MTIGRSAEGINDRARQNMRVTEKDSRHNNADTNRSYQSLKLCVYQRDSHPVMARFVDGRTKIIRAVERRIWMGRLESNS